MWEFIKYSTGKYNNSAYSGPVLDKSHNLVTDILSKMRILANHFKNLAMDTTGNSRATDKWESMLDYDIETFPECNEPIKWSEIIISLRDIPNNKSPGTDGILNEIWKMASNEILPTS
ncbi:hypothetical protein AYI68_g1577, partial [Smittium mucronatum]